MSGMGFGPGGIDCDDVLRDVYLYLDDESDDALKNRIRQHLDACTPCLKQFGLEQDVRASSRAAAAVTARPPACTSGSGERSPRSRSSRRTWSTAPSSQIVIRDC